MLLRSLFGSLDGNTSWRVSKAAKIPALSQATKILCFDLETNGLHGQAFAIGAIVLDGYGEIRDEFTARCPLKGEVDEWVRDNVLPSIKDMPMSHGDYEAMREAFWRWFVKTEPQVDYVLVSNGYPVEYRFLLNCQEANLNERYWQHPFPIIELSSLLFALGQLTEASKNKLITKVTTGRDFSKHHPLHDAKVTAMVAFEALGQAEKL